MAEIKTNIAAIDTYPKFILSLAFLEAILSVIFYTIGHFSSNLYLRGVGIGLVIAWVTTALAYLIVRERSK